MFWWEGNLDICIRDLKLTLISLVWSFNRISNKSHIPIINPKINDLRDTSYKVLQHIDYQYEKKLVVTKHTFFLLIYIYSLT